VGDRRLPRAALALSVAGWNNALVLLAPELSKDLPPVARDRDWESHLRLLSRQRYELHGKEPPRLNSTISTTRNHREVLLT